MRLDVHGFGLVILLQGVWFISAGTLLIRAGNGRRMAGSI
jgi:hypothetical protein